MATRQRHERGLSLIESRKWRPKTSKRGAPRMTRCIQSVSRFLTSEEGPTAVEYAVMLALILVACISIVSSLGQGTVARSAP